MEDIIKRILDIDKQTREMAVNAEETKEKAKKELDDKISALNSEYHEKAKVKIDELKKDIRKDAESKLSLKSAKNRETLEKMNNTYASSKQKWIDELFTRVTSN